MSDHGVECVISGSAHTHFRALFADHTPASPLSCRWIRPQGVRFVLQGFRCRAQGVGFVVWGLERRVAGAGCRIEGVVEGSGFRDLSLDLGGSGSARQFRVSVCCRGLAFPISLACIRIVNTSLAL